MAVKAVGFVQSIVFEPDATISIHMRIADPTHQADDVVVTDVSPATLDATLESDLITLIRDYAERNFETQFEISDTARLFTRLVPSR